MVAQLAELLHEALGDHPDLAAQVVADTRRGNAYCFLRAAVVPKTCPMLDLTWDLVAQCTIHLRGRSLRDVLVHPFEENAVVEHGAVRIAFAREAGVDDSGMHRTARDAIGPASALQLATMEKVHGLRDAVLRRAVVGLRGWRDAPVHVHILDQGAADGTKDHDPRFGTTPPGLAQLRHQQLGQQKVRQMIRGELRLEALLGSPELLGCHDAGIVHEVVQRQAELQKGVHERSDAR
mmetsp:Transcript_72071/g.203460  ORF Transcript_72071/g.203460 Transcript_72071/m.203460 type:complete len:236 (+) Transcript_72071:492-1199(+)